MERDELVEKLAIEAEHNFVGLTLGQHKLLIGRTVDFMQAKYQPLVDAATKVARYADDDFGPDNDLKLALSNLKEKS